MAALCRICMANISAATAISLYSELGCGEVVANMIIDCGDIVVCHDDGLPENVCGGCLARLEDAFALRKLIRKSDGSLREMVANKTLNFGEKEEDVGGEMVSGKAVNYPREDKIESIVEVDCYEIITLRGFRCCGCSLIFESRREVEQHGREKHEKIAGSQEPNGMAVECSTCHKVFANRRKLLNHAKNFQSNEIYHCKACNVLFDIKYRLEQHLKLSKAHRIAGEKEDPPKLNVDRKKPAGKRKATRQLKYPDQEYILGIEETPEYQLIHVGGERCCGCERIFRTYRELQEHCSEAHVRSPENALCECTLCYEKFDQIQTYNRHTSARTMKELYFCKLCDIVIDVKFRFDQHLKSSLTHQAAREQAGIEPSDPLEEYSRALEAGIEVLEITDVRCCGCDFTCSTRNELEDHSEETHGFQRTVDFKADLYQCDICFQRFPNPQVLQFHKNAALQSILFKCTQCELQSEIKAQVLQHLASGVHEKIVPKPQKPNKLPRKPPKNFVCCFVRCPLIFLTPVELLTHVEIEHATKRRENADERELDDGFICYVCHKSFRTERALQLHQFPKGRQKVVEAPVQRVAVRPGLECKECGTSFHTAAGLVNHERSHAPELWRYQCDVCDKMCPDEKALRMHRISHDEERPFVCDVCGKQFRRKGTLKVHKRCHREAIWDCPHCSSTFKTKSGLTLHIRSHTGEKPFQCRYCDNRYSHTTDRQRHEMSSHTQERPHRCDLCPAAFVRKRQLIIHSRTHTGERPFVCQVCNRGFIQSLLLKRHLATHAKAGNLKETEYMVEMLQEDELEDKGYCVLQIEQVDNGRCEDDE